MPYPGTRQASGRARDACRRAHRPRVARGGLQLFKHAGEQGVKPIIGCEVYVCDDASKQEKGYAHLTLLAESNEGYGNLIKLASAGYLQGYYYKPRVDWSLLETHSPGLIALSGCLSGRVSKALEESREADAAADLDRLVQVFGRDSTYVEIQNAGLDQQARINPLLARLAEGTGLPLVATGDVHYLLHEDARAHEALLCIQSGDSLKNPNHWRFDTDQFYFKTPEEMARDFAEYPAAVARTLEVAERCNVEIELGTIRLPKYPVPGGPRRLRLPRRALREGPGQAVRPCHARAPGAPQVRAEDDPRDGLFRLLPDRLGLRQLREAQRRLGRPGPRLDGGLARRLLPRDHRRRPDSLRPPLRALPQPGPQVDARHGHRLLGRRPRPRHQLRRREVRARPRRPDHHLRDDDGERRGARRGPRARGPYGEVDKIAKLIPEGPKVYLDECLKPGAELKAAYDGDPQVREIVDLAKPLEGLVRQDSIHAAGVVISDRPLTDVVPLQRKGEGQETVTQFGMWDVEALGLLKMDFLGLRNLDVIDKAVDLIGGGLDIAKIPMDDRKTFEMLARGDSIGVFQFESSGMREALKSGAADGVRGPDRARRPLPAGPDGLHPALREAEERTGAGELHRPAARGDHGVTHGICIYQEQYLEIAKQIAGFSPAEADDLRKAIGKKIHELMASLKEKFLEGCAQTDTPPAVANQLWKDMESSQDYSFGKAHAACYALIAYRTAWLRANHPREYMAALISSVMNTKDRVPFYVSACHELGIEVEPPDVNESECDFAVVEGKIRFGLNAVKNVGDSAARRDRRRAQRRRGVHLDLGLHRASRPAGREQARAGGARPLRRARLDRRLARRHDRRARLATAWGGRMQADRLAGQGSIFDLGDEEASRPQQHPPVPIAGARQERAPAHGEGDARRLRLASTRSRRSASSCGARWTAALAEAERRRDGEIVSVGGIVGAIKQLTTKKGEPMVFMRLDDLAGSIEVVVFNSVYGAARDLLELDTVLVVKGRVDHKQEGETKLIALEVAAFEATPERREVRLRVDARRRRPGSSGASPES